MPAGLQTCAMTREDRVRTGLRIVAAAFREGKLAAWTANGATGSPISRPEPGPRLCGRAVYPRLGRRRLV